MTRLTPDDVALLPALLPAIDRDLLQVAGVGLVTLACLSARGPCSGHDPEILHGVEVWVVPVTAGDGTIDGFAEAVAAVAEYVGCRSRVTGETDVAGLASAVEEGARIVLMADDRRFIALDLTTGRCIDNGVATGHVYAMALDAAARGLAGRSVLVLGLGTVGLAACATLRLLGADLLVYDPESLRMGVAERAYGASRVGSARQGLDRTGLVFDASTQADLIDAEWVGPESLVAAPGMPCVATDAAAAALGPRLIHEPLALGVAAMLAQSCLGMWTGTLAEPSLEAVRRRVSEGTCRGDRRGERE